MSQLQMTHNDVAKEVAWFIGYGRKNYADLSATQQAAVSSVMDNGLMLFYYPPVIGGKSHEWDFLRPEDTLYAWPAIAEDDDDSPVQVTSSGNVLTATANAFYPTMPGRTVTIKAATGTAATLTFANGRTALGCSSVFTAGNDWVGSTVKFDTSGESYTIASWSTSSLVYLEGDATDTTGNTGDTFVARRDYVVGKYLSPTAVELTTPPSPVVSAKLFSMAAGTYRMPADFAGLHGDLTFDAGEGYTTIPIINEGRVRDMLQWNSSAGAPRCAALRPVLHTGSQTTEQRYDLLLEPRPNKLYHLHYRYHVVPERFNTESPETSFFMGGPSHVQTILQACRAAAEHHINDEQGIEWQHFIERLQASTSVEGTRTREEFLGYNGDNSDAIYGESPWARRFTVTHPTATSPSDGRHI